MSPRYSLACSWLLQISQTLIQQNSEDKRHYRSNRDPDNARAVAPKHEESLKVISKGINDMSRLKMARTTVNFVEPFNC